MPVNNNCTRCGCLVSWGCGYPGRSGIALLAAGIIYGFRLRHLSSGWQPGCRTGIVPGCVPAVRGAIDRLTVDGVRVQGIDCSRVILSGASGRFAGRWRKPIRMYSLGCICSGVAALRYRRRLLIAGGRCFGLLAAQE